jgi:hypothetical protein
LKEIKKDSNKNSLKLVKSRLKQENGLFLVNRHRAPFFQQEDSKYFKTYKWHESISENKNPNGSLCPQQAISRLLSFSSKLSSIKPKINRLPICFHQTTNIKTSVKNIRKIQYTIKTVRFKSLQNDFFCIEAIFKLTFKAIHQSMNPFNSHLWCEIVGCKNYYVLIIC